MVRNNHDTGWWESATEVPFSAGGTADRASVLTGVAGSDIEPSILSPSSYSMSGAVASKTPRITISRQSTKVAPSKLPSQAPNVERLALQAERAVRDNVIGRCAGLLEKLAISAQRPAAAPVAADLFFIIRDYLSISPADPFADVAAALLDALSESDFWADATAEQYTGAASIARNFVERADVRDKTVDRALEALEALGFDTTPYGLAEACDKLE